MDMPFFPGRRLDPPEPLAPFLPPYYEGTGAEFLRRFGRRPARIVDPFGQSPALALELARSGAAVLTASPNPVLRAILSLQADPPAPDLLQDILSRLAGSPSTLSPDPAAASADTLADHIRGLYRGTCAFCNRESEAEGYVWGFEPEPRTRAPGGGLFREAKHRKQARLLRRICDCPHCRHTIEEPAVPGDERSMPPEASRQLLYHYALERLAPPDDPFRVHAAEALDAYPARSAYALILILRRVDAWQLEPEEKRALDWILLQVFDAAHMLRGHGHSARLRPRSLQPPAEFREVNIWRELERAARIRPAAPPVPAGRWSPGDPLPAGAIRIFAGTARDLAEHLDAVRPDGLICFLPRPNQAAWTLSAMWAEWLWGRSVAAPLSGSLHRRRYDWNWHARALTASAAALAEHLPGGAPAACLLGEWEPAFFAAALWAFYQSGFQLQGRAVRTDTFTAQLLWAAPGREHTPVSYGPKSIEPAAEVARLAARQTISARAEPVPGDLLQAAAWSDVVARHMLPPDAEPEDESQFPYCAGLLAETISGDPELESAEERGSGEPGGLWWLPGDESITSPLSDQVEIETARMLLEDGPLAEEELDRRICSFFPGLLTPERRLLEACLESYGTPADPPGSWGLRTEDLPDRRAEELGLLRTDLGRLGAKMGYLTAGADDLYWTDASGRKAFCFVLTASAAVGRFLLRPAFDPRRSWIVLPGGRAPLVGYKLRRNILLRRAAAGWRFLKFRHIRRLMDDPYLRPENLEERMGLDPLETTEDKVPYL